MFIPLQIEKKLILRSISTTQTIYIVSIKSIKQILNGEFDYDYDSIVCN